eukprot:scaffold682530_cov37-Prasinocladus_malaysianus.AAC.1
MPAGGPISTANSGSTWFKGIASLPWHPKWTQQLFAWHSSRRSAYSSWCRDVSPNAPYARRPAGISAHTVSATDHPSAS